MHKIIERWGALKTTLCYKKRLEKIQEKASGDPDNLLFQVRIGDFLAKLRKTKEAIEIYEQTAQKFIHKNLFAHAIALKKIIFRLEPMPMNGEQALVLERLYDQMLKDREKPFNEGQEPSLKTGTGSSS